MPQWKDEPTPRTGPRPLPILRTPVGRPLLATILTDRMACCATHFWGGRTVPCEAPKCDACNHGSPTREHAYIGIYDTTTHTSAILELPDGAAEQLALLAKGLPTLRGAILRASRTKSTRNARVLVELKPGPIDGTTLPTAPDLKAILAIVWKIPTTALTNEAATTRTTELRLNEAILSKQNGTPIPRDKTDATPRR